MHKLQRNGAEITRFSKGPYGEGYLHALRNATKSANS